MKNYDFFNFINIYGVNRHFFNSCIKWQTPTYLHTTTTTTTKQTNFDPIPKIFCHSNFGKAFGLRPLIINKWKIIKKRELCLLNNNDFLPKGKKSVIVLQIKELEWKALPIKQSPDGRRPMFYMYTRIWIGRVKRSRTAALLSPL